jgi:hypothetical protein
MAYQAVELPLSSDTTKGLTRLNSALKRAQEGGPPAVGQWMEFPGYTLSKTIAGLGSDVRTMIHLILTAKLRW